MILHHGDCLDVMAAMEPESVDAIVTDPPYGLEFMGKEWDRLANERFRAGHQPGRQTGVRSLEQATPSYSATSRHTQTNQTCARCGGRERGARKCACPTPEWKPIGKRRDPANEGLPSTVTGDGMTRQMNAMQQWHEAWAREAFRLAKPGAYLLSFGGTRTVHRLTCAIEDAGWIIRDMLVWAYASGFPKSRASLKPAWEPIVMARKPGPLRMLAVDACRIPMTPDDAANIDAKHAGMDVDEYERPPGFALNLAVNPMPLIAAHAHAAGRWPANVILTETPDGGGIFDGGWDGVVGGGEARTSGLYDKAGEPAGMFGLTSDASAQYADSGTYSRFFLIPKADRADREPVLGGLATKRRTMGSGLTGVSGDRSGRGGNALPLEMGAATRANHHPTVKPTELMRHLVRLVTPTGGIVLDPFAGSGSTLLAAEQEGFAWVGIEKEAEYVAIAEARLNGTQRGLGLPA